MRTPLSQLADEVTSAGITRAELEGVLFKLSPSQRRMYLRLARGPCSTIELRSTCSIGNISECANELNGKLARAKDSRRVVCAVGSHKNQYGDSGVLGTWSLSMSTTKKATT